MVKDEIKESQMGRPEHGPFFLTPTDNRPLDSTDQDKPLDTFKPQVTHAHARLLQLFFDDDTCILCMILDCRFDQSFDS